jgi:hypothetical protein
VEGVRGQQSQDWWGLLLLIGAALSFSLAATNRVSVLPLVAVPLIALVIRLRRLPRGSHKLFVALSSLLLSVVFIAYPVFYSSESNKPWKDDFGVTRTTIYFYYGTAVTAFSPQFSDHVFYGVIEDGPECLRKFRASIDGPGPFDVIDRLVRKCPAGAEWIDEEFNRRYVETLIRHPRVTLDHLRRAVLETAPGLVFSQALYGSNQVVTMLPAGIISLFDASVSDQAKSVPFLLWSLIGGVIAVSGVLLRRLRTQVWWAGIGLLFASGFGVVLTILALADELSRTAAPATAALVLSSVLLLQESVVSCLRTEVSDSANCEDT